MLSWTLLWGPKTRRKTSASNDKLIRVTSFINHQLTAPQIRVHISAFQSSSSRHVSTSIVRRRLRELGLYGRIAAKRPLTETNKKKTEWKALINPQFLTLVPNTTFLWGVEKVNRCHLNVWLPWWSMVKEVWWCVSVGGRGDTDTVGNFFRKTPSGFVKGYSASKESDGVLH